MTTLPAGILSLVKPIVSFSFFDTSFIYYLLSLHLPHLLSILTLHWWLLISLKELKPPEENIHKLPLPPPPICLPFCPQGPLPHQGQLLYSLRLLPALPVQVHVTAVPLLSYFICLFVYTGGCFPSVHTHAVIISPIETLTLSIPFQPSTTPHFSLLYSWTFQIIFYISCCIFPLSHSSLNSSNQAFAVSAPPKRLHQDHHWSSWC